MTDIAFLPARRLASLIRRRKIGCLELLEHYLDRVARHNPPLNAIIVTDFDAARRRARAADDALAKGETWGPLHGVPMTVKDSFDVAGLPTTWGSPDHKNNIARRNALSVDRWLNAGAVLFGKTNVPIWLADSQSFNAIYGTTNNPWDLSRTPGGSSGGASAALAAGLTGIEMGSDIAGSIRNPAAYCGLFGHKPTFGVCSTQGHALDDNVAALDILAIGPLARAADDLALGLTIIAGPDEIAARGARVALPPSRKKRLDEFRVGIVIDHPTAPVDRTVRDRLQDLADFLAAQNTHVSDSARPDIDLDDAHRTFDVLLRSATSARLDDAQQANFRAGLDALPAGTDTKQSRMMRGNTLSHRDWLRLDEHRQRMRWKWHDFFKEYDLLLCPVMCTAAYPHDPTPPYERTLMVDGEAIAGNTQLFWAGYSCVAYLPSTVAPIGFTEDGLPVGVQIVGPEYGDRDCIRFARLLEQSYQPFVPPAGYD
jgi:amidase